MFYYAKIDFREKAFLMIKIFDGFFEIDRLNSSTIKYAIFLGFDNLVLAMVIDIIEIYSLNGTDYTS